VTKNSMMGNDPFAEKKKELKDSGYSLTTEVAAYTTWGQKEITERQKKLAALAVKTWPLTT
jgi:hypothetical protein